MRITIARLGMFYLSLFLFPACIEEAGYDRDYHNNGRNVEDVGYYDCYTVESGSWYSDDDHDGWTEAEGDCNDGWDGTNPGADGEWRDGEDNDCNCWVDENCTSDVPHNEFCNN